MRGTITTKSGRPVVASSGHAAIYTRISDDKEGRGLGVERQEEDCYALAERLGVSVVNVFSDNDVSASTAKARARPRFDEMLKRARDGEFTHILAYSNSRLTRRVREYLDLIDLARDHGVEIRTVVSGGFDLNTADGRGMAIYLATQDQTEAERIGERVKRAAQQRGKDGRWHGGVPPFGYRAEKKALLVRDDEAALAIEAAERVLDRDEPLYSIIKEWRGRSIPTPTQKPGAEWRVTTLRSILVNPALAGLNSAGVPAWEPILDLATHHRLVERLRPDSSRRTNPLGVKSSKYALGGGLVRCARCRKSLHPVAREGVPTKFVCRAFANGEHPNHPVDERTGYSQGRVSIDGDALEEFVMSEAIAYLADDAAWKERGSKSDDAEGEVLRLRADREARQAERDRAGRAYIAGIMSEADAAAEVARLDAEVARLTRDIERREGGPNLAEVWRDRQEVLANWKRWPIEERRGFLRDVVASVTVADWPTGTARTVPRRKGESDRSLSQRRVEHAERAMRERVEIRWL